MTTEDGNNDKQDSRPLDDGRANVPLGGLLDGMANLIGKLGELAEKGQELKRSGQFESDDKQSIAGSYGFSVKFGAGRSSDDAIKVTPMVADKPKRSSPPARESREPHVDVFDETDHVLIIAEMPGVSEEQIELEFEQTQLTLIGVSPRIRFEKRIELGRVFEPSDVTTGINNGIVEIRLNRAPNQM